MDATVVAVASDGDDGDRRRPLLQTGNEILPYPESPSRPQPAGADAKPEQQKPQRVASLDVFRGLTVAMMILVDDAGGAWPGINHAPWFGVTVADFVMPAFLFIIGVSAALVFKKTPNKIATTKKAAFRAIKLFILGVILQGGYIHGRHKLTYGVDLDHIRLLGVLQRIAIGYFLAAISEIWLVNNTSVDSPVSFVKKYFVEWIMAIMISALYIGLVFGLYVPNWEFTVQTSNSTFSNPSNGVGIKTEPDPYQGVVSGCRGGRRDDVEEGVVAGDGAPSLRARAREREQGAAARNKNVVVEDEEDGPARPRDGRRGRSTVAKHLRVNWGGLVAEPGGGGVLLNVVCSLQVEESWADVARRTEAQEAQIAEALPWWHDALVLFEGVIPRLRGSSEMIQGDPGAVGLERALSLEKLVALVEPIQGVDGAVVGRELQLGESRRRLDVDDGQIQCGLRGSLGPPCNAVGFVDRVLLGESHLYKNPVYKRTKECSINSPDYGRLPPNAPDWCLAPFDPEGLLSELLCWVAFWPCLDSLQDSFTENGVMAASFNGVNSLRIFITTISKPLYTVSYMLLAGGVSGFLLLLLYCIVDVIHIKKPLILFQWMGMNALIVYVLAACELFPTLIQGFYWRSPENNLVDATECLLQAIFHSKRWGTLAFVLVEIIFWCLAACFLHMKGVYLRL
uniref:Heparan-alpha-glucosaminide N-acetyltransferase n=1 Tax=Aegilops tauschii TaxID=37682 RepID=M8BM15_AEGTA